MKIRSELSPALFAGFVLLSLLLLLANCAADESQEFQEIQKIEDTERTFNAEWLDVESEVEHEFITEGVSTNLIGLPINMPYAVAGGTNAPQRLGMPYGSEVYDWNNLKSENQYNVVRPCHYWEHVGGNHRWHGYHMSDNSIHDEKQFREWVRNNKGKTWIIGNELDVGGQDSVKAPKYVKMFSKYSSIIKSEDPSAKIAIGSLGGLKGNESFATQKHYYETFLSEYKKANNQKAPGIDTWNTHFYARQPGDASWVVQEYDKFVNWVRTIENGRYKNAELIMTEFGLYGDHSSQVMVQFMNDILNKLEVRVAQGKLDRFFWFIGAWCDCGGWTSSSLFNSSNQPSAIGKVYAQRAHQWLNRKVNSNQSKLFQHYARGGKLYGLVDGYDDWQDQSSNLPYPELGAITGFNSFQHPKGHIIQQFVRGGRLFARDNEGGKWDTTWTEYTDAVKDIGPGTITGFSSFVRQDGVILQHIVKGGKLYSRNNEFGWKKHWPEVTHHVSHVGSGTITGISTEVVPEGYISQYLVRGGRIHYRDSKDGFKKWGWIDITDQYDVGGGTFTDFNNFRKD